MDREKAIRAAYYTSLNGNINYDALEVKLFDQKFEPNANNSNYIIFSNQSSQDQANFTSRRWTSRITLQIVSLNQSSVSSDVVDDIGEQIEQIIIPGVPAQNGLTQQDGWQIINVVLESINYSQLQITDTKSVISKLLTFSQTIIKT